MFGLKQNLSPVGLFHLCKRARVPGGAQSQRDVNSVQSRAALQRTQC